MFASRIAVEQSIAFSYSSLAMGTLRGVGTIGPMQLHMIGPLIKTACVWTAPWTQKNMSEHVVHGNAYILIQKLTCN